jgi:hypothetical protein
MNKYAQILALSAGLVVAASLPASAQPMARHFGPAHCHGGPMVPMMAMRYPDGTLAFLHAELHITPAQASRWNQFAATLSDSIHNLHQQMQARREQGMGGRMAMALPEVLKRREAMMKTHLATIERIDGALIPLYQALDPAQQKTANQLFIGCQPHVWHGKGPGPRRPM